MRRDGYMETPIEGNIDSAHYRKLRDILGWALSTWGFLWGKSVLNMGGDSSCRHKGKFCRGSDEMFDKLKARSCSEFRAVICICLGCKLFEVS